MKEKTDKFDGEKIDNITLNSYVYTHQLRYEGNHERLFENFIRAQNVIKEIKTQDEYVLLRNDYIYETMLYSFVLNDDEMTLNQRISHCCGMVFLRILEEGNYQVSSKEFNDLFKKNVEANFGNSIQLDMAMKGYNDAQKQLHTIEPGLKTQ